MSSVNLIPASKRDRQQARRRRIWWMKFLRGYAIVLAICCGASFIPAQAEAPALDSTIARVDRRIDSRGKELDTLRRQSALLSRRLELARAIGDHPDWSYLLAAIGRARGDFAVLESIDFSIVKEPEKPISAKPAEKDAKAPYRQTVLVKLGGFCTSPADCVKFAGAIEQLNVFDRVTVKDTRAQPLGRMNATHFEIEAVIPVPAPTGGAK